MSTSTKPSDTKEKMFRAELLGQKLQHIEEQLDQLESQHGDLTELIESMERLDDVKPGSETLMSLAPGIFARGQLTDVSRLFVNVGMGVFVKKSPEEVHAGLQEQLRDMEGFEQSLRQEFNAVVRELDEMKEEFR